MYISGFEKTRFIRPLDKGGKKPDEKEKSGDTQDKPSKSFFQKLLGISTKPKRKESND